MGAGASLPSGTYQLTPSEIDTVYSKFTESLRVDNEACDLTPEQVLGQVMEAKRGLPEGAVLRLAGGGDISAGPPLSSEENTEVAKPLLPPTAGNQGNSEPADDSSLLLSRSNSLRSLSTTNRLKSAFLSSELLAKVSGEDEEAMLAKLFAEISTIIDGKGTELVVEEKEGPDWKALEMLGDEKMMNAQKEKGVIDIQHAHHAACDASGGHEHPQQKGGSKALQLAGESKAIANKKIRDRLGSDMSNTQMKKQQMQQVAENKKNRDLEEGKTSPHKGGLGGMINKMTGSPVKAGEGK